jgi:hypothetical protein
MRKIYVAIVAIVVAGAGFLGGMKYGGVKNSPQNQANLQNAFGRQYGTRNTGQSGNQNGVSAIEGQIVSMDDKSITIKLRDGGSKVVFYSTSTQVRKITEGSANDLSANEQITILGKTNPDGSVTAQFIQLRPPQTNPRQ